MPHKSIILTDSLIHRFWQKVAICPPMACWVWTGSTTPLGYGMIQQGGHTGIRYAHRIAYMLDTGVDPGPLNVLHRCDHPSCVNPAHLVLGTQRDNVRDMAAKERGNTVKLTADIVRSIRVEVATELAPTQRSLAARYGVSESCISSVVLGQSWKHVS